MSSLRCVLLAAAVAAGIPYIQGWRLGRAIDGVDTDITKAPWLVQVEYAELSPPYDLNINATCGGSIINNRQILTAAHCFPVGYYRQYATKLMRARLGATLKHNGGEIYTFESVEIHPDHEDGDSLDVAVITLNEEIQFSKSVKAIPLSTKKPEDGTKLSAGGWGVSSRTELEFHTQLKTVSLTLRNQENCTGFIDRAPLDAYNNENYMCLDGVNGITGSGDSGGGLSLKSYGRPKLVGLLKGGWTERNLDLFIDINMPAIKSFLEKTVINYAEARKEEAAKEEAEEKAAQTNKSGKSKFGRWRPPLFGWLPIPTGWAWWRQ